MPATAVLIPTTRPWASAERAARVARVQRSVGLDDVVDDAHRRARARRERRPRAETTPAVTEPPNPCGFPIATTSCPTRRRLASPSSAAREFPVVRAEHGEVGQRIAAADLRAEHAAVVECRPHAVPARDNVRGCEQEAVRGDRDGGAAASRASAAEHLDRGDRRRDPLGSLDHRTRIGVKWFFFVETLADERKSGHAARVAPACGRRVMATPKKTFTRED